MSMSNRHVHLPLSQGRGYEVGFFSGLMGLSDFQSNFLFEELGFSPSGETGEGFSCFALQSRYADQKPFDTPFGRRARIIPGQTVTKEKLQRDPLRPSGTSPKYDKKKPECGFKIYIVVFGGGRVGAADCPLWE
jgi:hypothetical protein